MTSEQCEPRSFELLQATGELLANTLRSDSVEITFKTEVQSLVFSGYTGDHAVTTVAYRAAYTADSEFGHIWTCELWSILSENFFSLVRSFSEGASTCTHVANCKTLQS